MIYASNPKLVWERILRRVIEFLLLLVLLSCVLLLPFNGHNVKAVLNPLVRVIPGILELGPQDMISQVFAVAIVVVDVADLQGLDIKFAWNTTFLDYYDHLMTMPVDAYSTPVFPSPYAGILNGPVIMITDVWDPPNGTCEVAMTTGGPSFTGEGTVFVIAFQVVYQPQLGEADVTLNWQFLSVDLTNSQGGPISYEIEVCNVTIYSRWNYADIDGNWRVDIFDVILGANAYQAVPGDYHWDPRCDIAEPYGIIDIFDIVMICSSYGEEYTP